MVHGCKHDFDVVRLNRYISIIIVLIIMLVILFEVLLLM